MFPLSFIFLVFFLFSVLVSYERKNHNILGPLDPEKNPPVSSRHVWGKGWETGATRLHADGTASLSLPPVQK